jgi:uncharacterized protein
MLRSFRVGNHKSFLTEQELLLMPSFDKQRSVVPVTAIYGANASGKSNLLNGLDFMRSAVLGSFRRWDPLAGVPRSRFRLAPEAAETPSTFVAEFWAEGVAYTYGFTLDDARIREEWLYSYPEKRKRLLFEREFEDVKFGSKLSESRGKLETVEQMTRPNALLLSVAIQSNIDFAHPVYRFFANDLTFSEPGPLRSDSPVQLARFIERHLQNKVRVVDLLRSADLGITDLLVEEDADSFTVALFDDDGSDVIQEVIPSISPSERRTRAEIRDLVRYQIKTLHGDVNSPFDLSEESHGTRSWLRLIPTALAALDSGSVLLVDEIDSSLHPLLTARLVGLFRDERTNPHGAQLIFTTHDTSLLGTMLGEEILKRDEVWFVSKQQTGATELYALSDFKPREGENTERRYLRGSYGAVPFVDHDDFVAAVRGES